MTTLLTIALCLSAFLPGAYGLGRVCHSSFDCSGGEQCTSGTCQCLSTQVSYNGRCITNSGFCTGGQQVYFNQQCYYTAQVGGQCYTSYQCLGGASCFNSQCVCPTGTSNMNGQCQDSNGNCNSNQIYYNGMCYNVANVNENCQIAAQCLGGSTCQNGICVCPAGTTLSGQMCSTSSGVTCPGNQVSVNGVCMNRVIPGQQCQGTGQCYDGAECSTTSRLCVCAEGMFILGGFCRKLSSDDPCDQTSMVYVNNQCMQVARPGYNCQNTLQCLGGSVCLNSQCQCTNGATLVDGYCVFTGTCGTNQVMLNSRCYDRVSIGQRCLVTEQCTGNSECDYTAICSCPVGTQNVGGTCQSSGSGGTCSTNQVSVNGVCMNRVAPGYSCQSSLQCLDQSICTNSICQCQTGYNLYNGYCVQSSVQGSCMQGQAYVNGQCFNLVTPGGSCTNNLQCLGASVCQGTCQCSSGYTNVNNYCVSSSSSTTSCTSSQELINGQCYNYAAIGQYCVYTQQCQGGSICQNNYCTCPTGSFQQGTTCSNNCATGQVFINGQCYYTAQIGQSCQSSQQCQGGSTCSNGLCQCPQGTYQQGTTCIQGSGGQCGTNQVYYNGQCYNTASIGQSCTITEQCLGGSTCLNMYCTCPTNTYNNNGVCTSSSGGSCRSYQVNNNGVCLDTVTIGMQCQVNAQCQIIASAICTQSSGMSTMTCQCPSGYYYTGSSCMYATSVTCSASTVYVNGVCLSLVQINQYCQQTAQCMGFSVCTNQVCTCPTGYTLVNNVCRSSLTKKKK